MLQRDYPNQVCSIARSLEVIGERWTLLILRDAVVGLTRFEEFQANLGIASNVLTSRLKRLCDEGLLERVPDPERPGRPKYLLTDKGRDLQPILLAMLACQIIHARDGARVAGYICGIVLLDHSASPWAYAFHRLLETALGVGVAWAISYVPKLIRMAESAEQRVLTAPSKPPHQG